MRKVYAATLIVFMSTVTFAQPKIPANNRLLEEFQHPGKEARPRVWWHWMNGNITKDGIRKDLLWMQRALKPFPCRNYMKM